MSFKKSITSVAKKNSAITPSKSDYYSHYTFQISSVAEYIDIITQISSHGKKNYSSDIIYRGLSNSDFKLIPGLSRCNNPDESSERNMIREFINRRPDDFKGLSSFDIIAKMQHYGLPTRMLDFTTNPLVALYFACEKDLRKNGRIVCHSTYLQDDDTPFVKSICNSVVNKYFEFNSKIDDFFCENDLTLRHYFINAYLDPFTTVVRPKYWNKRIANQSGVFMLFPNYAFDRYKYVLTNIKRLGVDEAIYQYGRGAIDRESLELAYSTEPIYYYAKDKDYLLSKECFKKMLNSYKDKGIEGAFWEHLHYRFNVNKELIELTSQQINNDFCSIIIKSSCKERILDDLSRIGFGTDYIYPELEYSAREIRKKYHNKKNTNKGVFI